MDKISRLISVLSSCLRQFWRSVKYFLGIWVGFLFGLLLIFFMPFLLLPTPSDQAFRNLHPDLPSCRNGLENGWDILAHADSDNDENEAIAKHKEESWNTLLRCSLQRHVIPSKEGEKRVDYHLAFLEFKEDGQPYSLVWNGANGDETLSSDRVKELLPRDYLELRRDKQIDALPITQLDLLRRHLLSTRSNYVIVFAHGWRHDASIGDSNVGDLRLYAAHVVRFLEERCKTEGLYCDTKVTAVYIGWRGARVNESALRRHLGKTIGGVLGSLAAVATLFDRKPVSEQIAPSVISALRALEKETLWPGASAGNPKPDNPPNRMIVFGHSLGGNLFATGLQDDLVKLVRRHKPGEPLPPVLGNLVVLINPASEAAKWTVVQREVWSRIAYNTDNVTDINVVGESHKFFPSFQKPVIVSVTAALDFPPGGLREGDCEWITLKVHDHFEPEREKLTQTLERHSGIFRGGVDYDWATHDLFPAFKFDFRPLADWADRHSALVEKRLYPCDKNEVNLSDRLMSAPLRVFSTIARYFPFQNSNQELSHTIGNLDPVRPANGVLVNKRSVPAAPFGTTHELLALDLREQPLSYASLSEAPISCEPANYWLSRVRLMEPPNGTNWDSSALAGPLGICLRPTSDYIKQGSPAVEFLHGLNLAGQQPITRANDPFWNMRARDALVRHDGYRLSSFICAMNQLVMDEVTLPPQSSSPVVGPIISEPSLVNSSARALSAPKKGR